MCFQSGALFSNASLSPTAQQRANTIAMILCTGQASQRCELQLEHFLLECGSEAEPQEKAQQRQQAVAGVRCLAVDWGAAVVVDPSVLGFDDAAWLDEVTASGVVIMLRSRSGVGMPARGPTRVSSCSSRFPDPSCGAARGTSKVMPPPSDDLSPKPARECNSLRP